MKRHLRQIGIMMTTHQLRSLSAVAALLLAAPALAQEQPPATQPTTAPDTGQPAPRPPANGTDTKAPAPGPAKPDGTPAPAAGDDRSKAEPMKPEAPKPDSGHSR